MTEFRRRVPIEREAEIRQQLVVEARSWLGTPAGRGEMVKGVGADHITFLIGVFCAVGLFTAQAQLAKHFVSIRRNSAPRRPGQNLKIESRSKLTQVSYLSLADRYFRKVAVSESIPSAELVPQLLPGNVLILRFKSKKAKYHTIAHYRGHVGDRGGSRWRP